MAEDGQDCQTNQLCFAQRRSVGEDEEPRCALWRGGINDNKFMSYLKLQITQNYDICIRSCWVRYSEWDTMAPTFGSKWITSANNRGRTTNNQYLSRLVNIQTDTAAAGDKMAQLKYAAVQFNLSKDIQHFTVPTVQIRMTDWSKQRILFIG